MLGSKDIEKVLIKDCEALGIVPLSRIYVKDDYPLGTDTRIVIYVKEQVRGPIFHKGFVEVNVVYPDGNDKADHESLEEAERTLSDAFKYDIVGEINGETYRYGLYALSVGYEPDAHYHYVNARLTFESLNI